MQNAFFFFNPIENVKYDTKNLVLSHVVFEKLSSILKEISKIPPF